MQDTPNDCLYTDTSNKSPRYDGHPRTCECQQELDADLLFALQTTFVEHLFQLIVELKQKLTCDA